MDATIESETSQTNSLISSGYFIENYSEGDSDKENNSTDHSLHIGLYWTSSEDKVKKLALRTNSPTLVPFSQRTNSLPLSAPMTTKISFLSVAFFCFYC